MAETNTVLDLENNLNALQEELDSYKYLSSEKITTENLRSAYAEELYNNGWIERAKEIILQDIKEPIFRRYDFNGDDEPEREVFQQLPMDCAMDIATIDNKIISEAEDYASLISGTISRLNALKVRLFENKQRIQDINFISSSYNNLSTVLRLTSSDFSGTFSTIGNSRTFCAFSDDINTEVPLTVESVEGNGYIGNKYVLLPKGNFLSQESDTSDYNNLTDDNAITVFEYSRLTATGVTDAKTTDLNKDHQPVICTITLSCVTGNFNTIIIDPVSNDITVQDILISNDGMNYYSTFSKVQKITTSEYDNFGYVAGSNVLSFPATQYAKIIFSSDHVYADEIIAEERTVLNSKKKPTTVIQKLENVVRKTISLRSLKGFYATRQDDSILQSYQLIKDGSTYHQIAVFANEYITENFSRKIDYISYSLYVNGKTYDVVPLNSDEDGIKILSASNYRYDSSSVRFIDEPIRSAQLIIKIKTYDKYSTPFVGNVKVCLG